MSEAMPVPSTGSSFEPGVIAMTITLSTVAALSVLLRCWIRLHITHNYGWDDALIVVALVGAQAMVVLTVWNTAKVL